jgi:hypothetical protein
LRDGNKKPALDSKRSQKNSNFGHDRVLSIRNFMLMTTTPSNYSFTVFVQRPWSDQNPSKRAYHSIFNRYLFIITSVLCMLSFVLVFYIFSLLDSSFRSSHLVPYPLSLLFPVSCIPSLFYIRSSLDPVCLFSSVVYFLSPVFSLLVFLTYLILSILNPLYRHYILPPFFFILNLFACVLSTVPCLQSSILTAVLKFYKTTHQWFEPMSSGLYICFEIGKRIRFGIGVGAFFGCLQL